MAADPQHRSATTAVINRVAHEFIGNRVAPSVHFDNERLELVAGEEPIAGASARVRRMATLLDGSPAMTQVIGSPRGGYGADELLGEIGSSGLSIGWNRATLPQVVRATTTKTYCVALAAVAGEDRC